MSDERKPVAIVTGGSRGFGAAHVKKLAEMGYNVAFCYMDPPKYADRAEQTAKEAEELGAEVFTKEVDVSDYDQVVAFVEDVAARFGDQIDVLVNNAGISHTKTLEESDISLVRKVIEIDLLGDFYTIKAVLPHMIPYKSGNIVNTGSTGSFEGLPMQTAYCASKTGILGMTRALQREVAPYIRVNTLCPGGSWTDMTLEQPKESTDKYEAAMLSKRFGQPEEQAQVLEFILKDKFVYGQAIAANGGEAFAR